MLNPRCIAIMWETRHHSCLSETRAVPGSLLVRGAIIIDQVLVTWVRGSESALRLKERLFFLKRNHHSMTTSTHPYSWVFPSMASPTDAVE